MKILVVYYSLYGHVYKLAEAAAKGVQSVENVESVLRRVPETLSEDVLEKMGATKAQKQQAKVPVCTVDELGEVDAIIFGTPTRFGNMCGQMRQFLDATGQLWKNGALVGKVGSVITSSNTQHGGTGIYDFDFLYYSTASRYGGCRLALCVSRINADGPD